MSERDGKFGNGTASESLALFLRVFERLIKSGTEFKNLASQESRRRLLATTRQKSIASLVRG